MTSTALIIDDEADIRELIAMSLDRIGFDTHTAANLEEARNLLSAYRFDVCLTDMRLPDGNGVHFVSEIQTLQPELPVAVITAHGNMDAAIEAMKNGAFDFVSKPVDIALLRKLMTQAVAAGGTRSAVAMADNEGVYQANDHANPTCAPLTPKSSHRSLADSTSERHCDSHRPTLEALSGRRTSTSTDDGLKGGERLIGRSEAMSQLRKLIAKVARTNAPVWITGESGTGKELIARLVHENGPRADAPFVAINCGAIPGELMESELFGHRKGSFTGAHSDHDGLFRRAEGGTLFLDEVAELPLHMQVKLLRAIQERSIRPVGASEEMNIDVRILSASHKDLAQAVEEGRFRHDLYYRLNVISIQSPSLRDRGEDVIEIARHVLKGGNGMTGTTTSAHLTPDAESLLARYPFPGNVRELENILERAVALSDDGVIDADALGLPLADAVSSERSARFSSVPTSGRTAMSDESRERELIVQALEQTRWNRKAAASKLGLTYRQLRYRISQYGIDSDLTGT